VIRIPRAVTFKWLVGFMNDFKSSMVNVGYLPGILVASIYLARTIEIGISLKADDSWMYEFYTLYEVGKVSFLEYLFATHNGSPYVLLRSLYMVEAIFGFSVMLIIQNIFLLIFTIWLLKLIFQFLVVIGTTTTIALLLCTILGLSHTFFQLLGSILGYLNVLLSLALFFRLLLSFVDLKYYLSKKQTVLVYSILACTGSASVTLVVALLVAKLLLTFKLSDLAASKNLRKRKPYFSTGILSFAFIYLSIIPFSANADSSLIAQANLGNYPQVARMGESNLTTINQNFQAIIHGGRPYSPYAAEYGNGGIDLFLNSITVNLLNWLIPTHIYDDNQNTFGWVNQNTLVFFFCFILVIFLYCKDSLGLRLLSMLLVVILVSQVPLFLLRGDSFAWYHMRYQLLLPFLSIVVIARTIVVVSKPNVTRIITSLTLTFLLFLTFQTLISSPRF
jgi:hypothetical protein